MLKITDENYTYYKGIFKILWLFQAADMHIDPETEDSPINILNAWEKQNKSLAKKGLKTGLNDLLTMSMDFSKIKKKQLSDHLVSKDYPKFEQLISKIKNLPNKILKRGIIKNVDEYYVIKEFLADSNIDLTKTEFLQLSKILNSYEENSH